MARMRTIKPEFWTDGVIVSLSPFARLFYIGTWNFALGDCGHLPDDPIGLKLKVLPLDPVDPEELIAELIGKGRIERVTVGGRSWLILPRFTEHQKSDPRWKSRCPACALSASTELAETPVSLGEPRRASSQLSLVIGGEGSAPRDAAEPPSRFCDQHTMTPSSSPCGACKDARLRRELWDTTRAEAAPTYLDDGKLECPDHPNYPHPASLFGCARCDREKNL